jgi:hypothetical protein
MMRDCQVINDSLTVSDVEISIANMAKNKRLGRVDQLSKANPKLITFTDYLQLLMDLAPDVHPESDSNVVFQRMLMENILPLASRRDPVDIAEYYDEDVRHLLNEEFRDSLQSIFDYYCNDADRRRLQECAQDTRNRQSRLEQGHVATTSRRQMREMVYQYRGTIGYKEYIQFCQDFSLCSTALLTSLEVGDIFLSSIPQHEGGDVVENMNFEEFVEALFRMSLVAYKDAPASVTPLNKVKALLLFIWKVFNSAQTNGNTRKARNNPRPSSNNANSGNMSSTNEFGSGRLSDQFLEMWRREGFVEYLTDRSSEEMEGRRVLNRIVETDPQKIRERTRRQELLNQRQDTKSEKEEDDDIEEQVFGILSGHLLRDLFVKRTDVADVVVNEIRKMDKKMLANYSHS